MAVGEITGSVTVFPFPCRQGQQYEVSELKHATARLTDVLISSDDQFMVTAGVDGIFQWRVVEEEDSEDEAEAEKRQMATQASQKRLLEVNSAWDSMDFENAMGPGLTGTSMAGIGIDSRLLGDSGLGVSSRSRMSSSSAGSTSFAETAPSFVITEGEEEGEEEEEEEEEEEDEYDAFIDRLTS
jgi:hypothetical protein